MDEIKRYKIQLLEYPSFLKVHKFMKEERLVKKCLSNTSEDLECEFEEDIEYSTAFNVISFLAFHLGDFSKAKEYNDKALEKNEHDIIALVNKGWFCLKSSEIDFVECQHACDDLKLSAQNEIHVLEAKAQIAYILSRLGPKAQKKAEECFSEVLQFAEKNERVPDSHIILWNFGLGLTRRRLLNVFNCSNIDKDMFSERNYERALEPFLKNMSKDGATSKHRARSIMHVGEIVYSLTEDELLEKLKNKLKLKDTEYYCNLAIKLEPMDYYILQICGRQLRYLRDTQKAIEHLKKAIEIRPTSYAHHNLALALRMEITSQKSKHTYKQNCPKEKCSKSKKNMIKSPRYVMRLENTDKVKKVFFHLNEAVKMDENVSALYDIGLLYRSTKQLDEAKDTFKRLRIHPGVSPVILKNTYEQLAYCILEGLENSDDRGNDRANAVKLLKQALELTCNTITKNNPEMKEAYGGVLTLKELLSCSVKSKKNLTDYADLCEMIKEHKEAVDVLHQLIEKNSDAEENFETYMRIVRILKEQNDITGAIMTLNLLMVLPDGPGNIDLDLYIEVQIEGGIESYLSGDKLLAKERLQNALQFRGNPNNESQLDHENTEEAKDDVDIFILSQSFSTEGISFYLLKILRDIGISTTANDFDIPIGTLWFKGMEKIIKDSKRFIIVCDLPENPSNSYYRILDDIESKRIESGRRKIVVLKSSKTSVLQSTLQKYPSVVACNGIMQADIKQPFDLDTVQWMKELLLKLLCRK